MGSTVAFNNMIRRIIKHNESFYPTTQYFKFKVDGSSSWYPVGNSYISCGISGYLSSGSAPPYLQFHYAHGGGDTVRYYLPEGGGKIDRVKVYCRYGNEEQDEYIELHDVDITDGVTYDDNDFIKTITVQININTSYINISDEIIKHLVTGLGTVKNIQPSYFKFYDSSFGVNSGGWESAPINQSDDDVPITIESQLDGLGLSDLLSLRVISEPIEQDDPPAKYRLFTEDNLKLDEGSLNQDSTTSNIPVNMGWLKNDTVAFTYTHSILDQIGT